MIVADAGNRAATNGEQWYVSISRGRKRVVVLTPDRTALRENNQRSSARELALEETPERKLAERELQWRACGTSNSAATRCTTSSPGGRRNINKPVNTYEPKRRNRKTSRSREIRAVP